jgi:ubiquinone/menaquinone biosynthesis C-methylase UbiE
LVKTNSKIALDFGCGSGNVTSKLLELGWKVVAVDSSEAMLQTLRKKFQKPSHRVG